MGISSRLWFDTKQAKQICWNMISKGFSIYTITRSEEAERQVSEFKQCWPAFPRYLVWFNRQIRWVTMPLWSTATALWSGLCVSKLISKARSLMRADSFIFSFHSTFLLVFLFNFLSPYHMDKIWLKKLMVIALILIQQRQRTWEREMNTICRSERRSLQVCYISVFMGPLGQACRAIQ